MLVAILVRGLIKVDTEVKDTLHMLRLNRKNHCVVVKKDQIGMLRKARSLITWGEINDDVLKKMVAKRGRLVGNKKIDPSDVDKILENVKSKKSKEWGIKPVFRLSPPSKGFRKSIRYHYPKGELGDRGEKINELLLRMI
jgi:large subunit ribosomal protein L30